MKLRSWDLQCAYQSPSSPPASLVSAGPHQSGQVCWSFLKSKLKTKLLSELPEWVPAPGTAHRAREILKESPKDRHSSSGSCGMLGNALRDSQGSKLCLWLYLPVLVEHLQGSCSRTSTAGAAPLPQSIHQSILSILAGFPELWNPPYQKQKKGIAESSNICQAQQHLPLKLLLLFQQEPWYLS